jgi:hypothetical protein
VRLGEARVQPDRLPVGGLGVRGAVLPAQAVSLVGVSGSLACIRGMIGCVHISLGQMGGWAAVKTLPIAKASPRSSIPCPISVRAGAPLAPCAAFLTI